MYSRRYNALYDSEVATGSFRARLGRFLAGCMKEGGELVRYRIEKRRPVKDCLLQEEMYITAKFRFQNDTTIDIEHDETGPCWLIIFSENSKDELPQGITGLIETEFSKEEGKCYSLMPMPPA